MMNDRIDQTRRPPLRWALLAALLLVVAACGAASTSPTAAPSAGPDDGGYALRAAAQLQTEVLPSRGEDDEIWGRTLDLPLPAPDFELIATDGTSYDFARDADAAVTLVYFGYTSCPDVCPTHMAALASAVDELTPEQRARVEVLFVSVDPTVDTPEQLASYLDNFGPDITGLTGTPEQINAALGSVGLPRTAIGADADGPPDHPSSVLGYAGDGRAHVVWPFGTTTDIYLHDIRMLLDADRKTTT